MVISPQRLTIYLYSAHRAVIFAIAQLSCSTYRVLTRDYSYLLIAVAKSFYFQAQFGFIHFTLPVLI